MKSFVSGTQLKIVTVNDGGTSNIVITPIEIRSFTLSL